MRVTGLLDLWDLRRFWREALGGPRAAAAAARTAAGLRASRRTGLRVIRAVRVARRSIGKLCIFVLFGFRSTIMITISQQL